MSRFLTLTAAAAFALAVGFGGVAKAEILFPFDTDLVGYWSFDDEVDPTADNSGKGHPGTLGSTSGTGGTSGTDEVDDPVYDSGDVAPIPSNAFSLDFDGVFPAVGPIKEPDFVSIDDDSDFDLGTVASPDFTIAAWINTRVTSSPFDAGFQYIVSKDDASAGRSYFLYLSPGPKLFAAWFPRDFPARVNNLASTTTTIALNTWTHVALTYSYDSGTDKASVKTYVNGVVDQSTANGAGPITNTTTKINIARSTSTDDDFRRAFDGHIDEVRMYDVALTADQIELLASSFPGTVEKELVSGPNNDAGNPIVVDVNPLDAGGIEVSRPTAQHFEIKITITNDAGDGAIDGLKVFDVFGAEFDPDPDAEDASIPEAGCTIGEGGDGTCDGIQAVGGTGDCTATINPHDGNRKLDPHFVRIVLTDLEGGETCIVTVWVETSENPASAKGKKDDQWEPTSCDLVMDPDLFNTFTLNEGLKVFDPDSGIRLLGPVGSLQLTCNFP